MVREPADSHGFGICVKGGKEAGETSMCFLFLQDQHCIVDNTGGDMFDKEKNWQKIVCLVKILDLYCTEIYYN